MNDPNSLAFGILVREHHAGLIAYGQSLYATIGRSMDMDAAEDLVQEALLIAFENLAKYDHDRGFAPWVRGIMRFRFLKKARNREKSIDASLLAELSDIYQGWYGPQVGEMIPNGAPQAWNDQSDLPDALAALEKCLQQLSPDQRASIEGYYFGQEAIQDLAQSLQSSVSAVKKRLQRSRQQLAECIRLRLAAQRLQMVPQSRSISHDE